MAQTTKDKLNEALQKFEEGIELLKAARDENKSLAAYYNIDEDIINELERVTTNPKCFQGNFYTIEDIIEDYGINWCNNDDGEYNEMCNNS